MWEFFWIWKRLQIFYCDKFFIVWPEKMHLNHFPTDRQPFGQEGRKEITQVSSFRAVLTIYWWWFIKSSWAFYSFSMSIFALFEKIGGGGWQRPVAEAARKEWWNDRKSITNKSYNADFNGKEIIILWWWIDGWIDG